MMDFNCPHCSFGMNKEDISEVHEDDLVGEWDIECRNCKKEIQLNGEATVDYWAVAKTVSPEVVEKSLKEVS